MTPSQVPSSPGLSRGGAFQYRPAVLIERSQPHVDPDWEADFEAALRRPLRLRLDYGFVHTPKPVMDDAPYRVFDRMEDYRRWCREELPAFLGYG